MNRPLSRQKRWMLLSLMSILPVSGQAGDWDQIAKILASDRASMARFGYSVSISGDYAIVGAYTEECDAAGADPLYAAGAAYVFIRDGGNWVQQQKLVASDRHEFDLFGCSVALSGEYAIVGAYCGDFDEVHGDSLQDAGAAYIFRRSGSTWTEVQKIVAVHRLGESYFGFSVALSGDNAIVGACRNKLSSADTLPSLQDAGAAYFFVRTATGWTQQEKITAHDRAPGDYFGWSVSISGDYAIVGALFKDIGGRADAGAAYLFSRIDTSWVESQKLVAYDTAGSANYGSSVSLSGDYAVVGAPRENYDTAAHLVPQAGAAYVYLRSGDTWTHQQKLFADYRTRGAGLGYAISMSEDRLIAGCDTWEAHIFGRSGSTWSELRKLVASDTLMTDSFGHAVAMSGDYAIVGAASNWLDAEGENSLPQAGAAYVFGPGSTGMEDFAPDEMPQTFRLDQNFPNPFNPATTITFELPQASAVRLSLFDLLGREVSVLLNEKRNAGVHAIRLDGTHLASGVYLYQLKAHGVSSGNVAGSVLTRKLVLVR